jgi:hypothetical protein
LSVYVRAFGLLIAIMIPACFWFGSMPPFVPDWQAQKEPAVYEWFSLLSSHWGAWPFYLLIAYALFNMLRTLFSERGVDQPFWVRFGLYTGVALSLQYALLLVLTIQGPMVMIVGIWCLAGFSPLLLHKAIMRLRSDARGPVWAMVVVVICTGIAILGTQSILVALVPVILYLACVPYWACAMFTWLSYRVYMQSQKAGPALWVRALVWAGWIAAYVAAWRVSIYFALKYFEALPDSPPYDCYVATAAARGHAAVVGSKSYKRADGVETRVNWQMRYLKCGELALKMISPRMHRVCRTLYDCIGPLMARLLVRPVLADTAYLLLKPSEWLVRGMLWLAVPAYREIADSLYRR